MALLGSFDACTALQNKLTGGGETVRMQPTHLDRHAVASGLGERLLESMSELVPVDPGRERVLFIGNSQQYTASLPKGGVPDMTREAELASSRLLDALESSAPGRFAVYTAAAPNQNFAEALWQSIWWFEIAPSAPRVLVLQASFDTFRKDGVRPGFQTLLDDERYASDLGRFEEDHAGRAWADLLHQAEHSYEERKAATKKAREKKRTAESTLREGLAHVPLFAKRETLRASFLGLLYLVRVHALGISPTTKRHIAGQPFEQNFQALEDLIDLANASGCRVFIYNAPINPAVDMFFDEEYRAYMDRLTETARRCGAELADLRDAVAPPHWGYWIDGPDPIHFDENGHADLADALFRAFGSSILRPPSSDRPATPRCGEHGLH